MSDCGTTYARSMGQDCHMLLYRANSSGDTAAPTFSFATPSCSATLVLGLVAAVRTLPAGVVPAERSMARRPAHEQADTGLREAGEVTKPRILGACYA